MLSWQIGISVVGLLLVAGPWLLKSAKGLLPQVIKPLEPDVSAPDHDLLAELVHLRTCMKSAPDAVAAIDQTLIPAAVKMLSEVQE